MGGFLMSAELCRLCFNRTYDGRRVLGEDNEYIWICNSCSEIYVAKLNGEERLIEVIE